MEKFNQEKKKKKRRGRVRLFKYINQRVRPRLFHLRRTPPHPARMPERNFVFNSTECCGVELHEFYELFVTNDDQMVTNPESPYHVRSSEDRGSRVGVHDRVHMACFIP